MKGDGNGQSKHGRGKPEGKGKGRGKGQGQGSGARAGRTTYADPGRPKTLQPTERDRQGTGNIAEYFLRYGKGREQVQHPDPLIEKLETMIKSMSKHAKGVATRWSPEDKRTVMAVLRWLNRK